MGDVCRLCDEWLPCRECGRVPESFTWQMTPAPAGLWAVCQWEDGEDLEDYPVVAIAVATASSTQIPTEYSIERTFYLLAGLQEHEGEGWVQARYVIDLIFPGKAQL